MKKRKLKNQSRTEASPYLYRNCTIDSTGSVEKRKGFHRIFEERMDFSPAEVRGVLKFFNLPEEEYLAWMNGQTCPMLPDGNIGYYFYDLERYVKWKVKGDKPIWD
jgi:hypothetical protein